MIRVIAIHEEKDGRRWQNEWLRVDTRAEATAAIGQAIGQGNIVDGYWLNEGDELLPIAQTAAEEAARVAAFHAAVSVPSPLFG